MIGRAILSGLIAACLSCGGDGIALFPTSDGRVTQDVIIMAPPVAIPAGDTVRISAYGYDSNGNATSAEPVWNISNGSSARLDASADRNARVLRALAPGRVEITASVGALKDIDTVWIVPRDARVHLSIPSATMRLGDTLIATVTVSGVAGLDIGPARASVSADGLPVLSLRRDTLGHWNLLAVRAGTVRVTAFLGRLSDSASMTVVP